MAEEEQPVGVFEIVQGDGGHRHADALRQRHRGALVAHVGTVWQVVGAVHPRQHAIHVGRLQRGSAGHVEHHLIWIGHGLEFGTDLGEGLIPADRQVMVAGGVVAQWMSQATLLLQIVIAPIEQLADAVFGKELGPTT